MSHDDASHDSGSGVARASFPPRALAGAVVVAAATLGAVLLMYVQTLQFGLLNGDDFDHVANNAYLRELSVANLHWMLGSATVDYWRPLSFLSHALDFHFWGEDYGGHHLTSLLLHYAVALAAALLAALIWTRFAGVRYAAGGTDGAAVWAVALLAALVFALHPQHVQSVAWIAERKGLLCALFTILTVVAYMQSHVPGARVRTWRVVTVLLFFLAMMSKPMAISIPLVLLAIDVYPLRRITRPGDVRRWLALIVEKLPLLLAVVLVVALTYLSMRAGNFFNTAEMFPFAERVVNATRSLWLYALRFIAPLQLSPMYPLAVLDNSVSLRNLLPGAGLVLVLAGALFAFARGRPQWLAGVLAYLAWLVPVSGIVSSGPQSSADRYAYMPGAMASIVLAIALTQAWLRLRERPAARALLVGVVSLWAAWLTLTAHQYTGAFRDDRASTKWVELYFPQWQPFVNYIAGVEAFRRGDLAVAEQQLQVAIRLNQARARARLHLAMVRELQGANGIAHELVRAALAGASHDPYVVQLAAQVLTRLGRGGEAKALLDQLIAQFPDSRELKLHLAQAHLSAGDAASAAALLDAELALAPDDIAMVTLRAVVAQVSGDKALAQRLYERVLTLDPDNGDASNNLEVLREDAASD